MSRGRSRYISAAGVALVGVLAAACGSSSNLDYSAPSVEHPVVLPAQQPLEKQVDSMVLTGGDFGGWKIVTRGFEKVGEQTTKSRDAGAPAANRFVRDHWQASYHTIFRYHGDYVLSGANVYDSTQNAQKAVRLQRAITPSNDVVTNLPVPDGAPPGSWFEYQHGEHSGYMLAWVQGSVIAMVATVTDRPKSAAETAKAARTLTGAAAKQADRISKVIEAHASAMAAK